MHRIMITTTNYYRLALLLPYIVWATCTIIIFLNKVIIKIIPSLSGILEWLYEYTAYIFFSIFIWFIPYTILIIGLMLWSIKNHANKFITTINFSPIILAATIWVSPLVLELHLFGKSFLERWLILAIICLITGYIFVAIFHVTYRLLQKAGRIKVETVATDTTQIS